MDRLCEILAGLKYLSLNHNILWFRTELLTQVTLIIQIQFDEAKRAATIKAGGLDMARAGAVLDGPPLTVEDDRQDYSEVRFITIGVLDDAMAVLVWTPRDEACWIISIRRANERERRLYGPRF